MPPPSLVEALADCMAGVRFPPPSATGEVAEGRWGCMPTSRTCSKPSARRDSARNVDAVPNSQTELRMYARYANEGRLTHTGRPTQSLAVLTPTQILLRSIIPPPSSTGEG